jgi:mono/diheme cytochrome c family protein
MKKSLLVFILVMLALLLVACDFSLAEDITPPPNYVSPTPPPTLGPLFPAQAPDLVSGAAIFAQKCEPCHGATGMGDGPQAAQLSNPPAALAEADVARPVSPAKWFTVVSQGDMQNFMPPFSGSLTEQQRWDVVAYAMSLSTTADQIAQGKSLYAANCAECHGQDGKTVAKADFTDQASMAKLSAQDIFYAITQGMPPSMPALGDKLSEDQSFALAAYVRTFTFARSQAAATAEPAAGTPVGEIATTGTPAGEIASTESPPSDLSTTPEAAATPVAGVGTVTGKLSNGSGDTIPSGLTVSLQAFDQDASGNFSRAVELSAAVAADGSYSFKNVEMPDQRAFIATLMYEDVEYSSEPVFVTAGQSQIDLPITFYETSTDTHTLSVDRWHIFFDFSSDTTVQVIELVVVTNPTNKTIVPAEQGQPILNFTTPQGAINLQFEDTTPGRFIQTDNGFGDTSPILPGSGQHQVVFAYDMPYNKQLELSRKIDLPVNAATILVPDGLTVKSDLLTSQGPSDFQGVTYNVYSSQPLPAGAILEMSLSGKPKSTGTSGVTTDSRQNLLIGLGALGLVLVLGGIFLFVRDRRRSTSDDEDELDVESIDELDDADSIMDAIIALDDLHRAGKIADEAYETRRAELKARLKELL